MCNYTQQHMYLGALVFVVVILRVLRVRLGLGYGDFEELVRGHGGQS